MRTIFRKLLFVFVLFVMPFVSSNAFAACKRIVFAYAPTAADTTNVVYIERYYNDSNNTWFVDARCSGTGTSTVEIPLRGVFDKIPVIFESSGSDYSYFNGIIPLGRDATGTIECSRNVPDVLTCGLGRSSEAAEIVAGHYSPRFYYNNVYTSGTSSCRIGRFYYDENENYSLKHECLAGGCTSFPVKGISDTTLNTFYYDSSADSIMGFYYEDSACSQFLGSFDVSADLSSSPNAPLPITFNAGSYGSPTTYDVVKTTQVTESRGAGIYCNYDQATDYVNSVATATCQFDYGVTFSGRFTVSAVLRPAAISTGTVSVYREDGYSYVKPTYPCHKVDVYYMINNGNISTTPVTVYNNQKGSWFSDAACETSISNIEIPATFGVPVVYATTSGSAPSRIDATYFVTNIENQTTPIMCNYSYSTNPNEAVCTPLVNFSANTSLYPRTYVAPTSTAQSYNVVSTVDDTDNKVDIEIFDGDGTCFAVYLLLNMDGATAGNITKLYRKTGSVDLYYDERCTEIYNRTYVTELPKKEGYTLRGFFTTQYAAVSETVSGDDYEPRPVLNYDMQKVNSADGITTLYAAWAKNCDSSIPNGSCSLQIGPAGQVVYTTTCNDGYDISGNGTATPSCTVNCIEITLNPNDGGAPQINKLYKISGQTTFFTDSGCTKQITEDDIQKTAVVRSGYTFRGYYLANMDDVDTDTAATTTNMVYINNTPALTPAATSWKPTAPQTLYAAWAKDCPSQMDYGTCSLSVDANGNVDYTIVCNDGYSVVDDNTANASCTDACYLLELTVLGNSEVQRYYTNGVDWFSDESCINQQKFDLPDAPNDMVILYFAADQCDADQNRITDSAIVLYDALTDVPCTYSSDTDVTSCNFPKITGDTFYCASDFAMRCVSNPSAGCELDVTLNGTGSINVDYTNSCLPGYH